MPIAENRLIERIAHASESARPPRRSAPARVLRHRRRLRLLSALPGPQTLVTTDFRSKAFTSAANGIRRLRWPPLPHPRTLRHRGHGRRTLRRISIPCPARPAAPALGRPVFRRPPESRQEGRCHPRRRRSRAIPRRSPADITVVGTVPEGKAILRSTAQPGDRIFVSGELGAPCALLEQMYAAPERRFRASSYPAHFYPRGPARPRPLPRAKSRSPRP